MKKVIGNAIGSLIMMLGLSMCNGTAFANMEIVMQRVDGDSPRPIGNIKIEDTDYGLLLTPNLIDLPPGLHGFHLHTHPSCANHGLDAQGHFDPQQQQQHRGPYHKQSHLGDLPTLYVDARGNANSPVLAPRLKEVDLKGHALVIHAQGDNYADLPTTLGGGGARIACGIIDESLASKRVAS